MSFTIKLIVLICFIAYFCGTAQAGMSTVSSSAQATNTVAATSSAAAAASVRMPTAPVTNSIAASFPCVRGHSGVKLCLVALPLGIYLLPLIYTITWLLCAFSLVVGRDLILYRESNSIAIVVILLSTYSIRNGPHWKLAADLIFFCMHINWS